MWKWNVFLVLITCFRPAPILGYAKKSNPHGSYPKTMLLPDKLTGLEKTHPHRVTKRATCGQILTSSTGTVTSPNYPSNYPSNSNCVTTIQAPTNKIIEITLTDVKIEIESYTSSGDPDHPAGIRCLWDYVEFEDVGIARTKYCGEFSGRVWTSFDSKVNVLFFSDDSAQYRGFAASYTFLDKPTDPLMFDFGVSTADIEFPPADDGSVVLNGISYTFFGTSHSQLWVNTNGVLSFDDEELSYSPLPIPHGTNHLLAPYWADVDVRSGGQLFYRQTTDTATLDKADTIISSAFGINFQSTSAIVITWYDVAFFATSAIGQKSRNTFQAVLVTDSNGCGHVIFNYADITWTTGASVDAGGDVNTGLGGIAAQVGFDAGDGVRFFVHPDSRTSNIKDIDATSNIGVVGRWVFNVCNQDIGECSSANGGCDQICHQDSNGGFISCSCNAGYTLNLDGQTCDEINPCVDNNGGCSQVCTHTGPGESTCSCNPEYTIDVDGVTCIEINGCVDNNGGCEVICIDLGQGNVACDCSRGYELNTDGITCQQSTFIDSVRLCRKFSIHENELTWSDSRTACEDANKKLLSIQTSSQNMFIASWLDTHSSSTQSFWFGLNRFDDLSQWGYEDGPLCYSNWKDSTQETSTENCAQFWSVSESTWTSESCDEQKGYICEY